MLNICHKSPNILAHSCTKFPCYLGMENLAQGSDSIYGGCRLEMVLWGPKLTKTSAVFGKYHLPT